MADTGRRDYPIGYKRPPRAKQFKPGQSGNAKGRPKGARNFATALTEELNARVVVTENGRRRRISKREAVAKQLVNKAAAGDLKAIPVLLNETRPGEDLPGAAMPLDVFSGAADQQVMASIVARIRAATQTPAPVPAAARAEPEQEADREQPTEEQK
jgi:hypothetical protein